MNVLIIKYYQYESVEADPRFSFEIAFRRLNAVIENARKVLPSAQLRVFLAPSELPYAHAHVRLNENERITTFKKGLEEDSFFKKDIPLLVLDEQSFFATTELIRKVISNYGGPLATWSDPEHLLYSFGYNGSCSFFIAQAQLVRKCIRASSNFLQLQKLIDDVALKVDYPITPEDIPSIYRRALHFNPYPYHFCIEPTSKCNSKCIMCPFHSPDPKIASGRVYVGDDGEDMPLSMFKSIVDEVASIGWNYLPHYRHLQITPQLRGEPTLAPDCRAMFSYVKEKGLRLSFTTNGSTLHLQGLSEFLIEIGTDEIVISIDGDEEEYRRIRPALNYQRVVENLETLRRLRDVAKSKIPIIYTKRVHLRDSTVEADRAYINKFAPIADWAGIAFENFADFKTGGKGYTEYFFDVDAPRRLPRVLAADVAIVKSDGRIDMCYGFPSTSIGDVFDRPLLENLGESRLRSTILSNQGIGNFEEPGFCSDCTSWKANYMHTFEEDHYMVQQNPVLSYWKKRLPKAAISERSGMFRLFKNRMRSLFLGGCEE
jgi:Radical SAM superfamily